MFGEHFDNFLLQCETANSAQKSYDGSQVCMSVGIIRASGLKVCFLMKMHKVG